MGVDIQTYRAKIGTYRHSTGTDVVTIVLTVNFSQSLKCVGCVTFMGILLIMAGIEQNPGPRESDVDQDLQESFTEASGNGILGEQESTLHAYASNREQRSIFVTGLPEQISAQVLSMYFENEYRNGGGRIKEVTVNDQDQSAIIEFEAADAVGKVMQKLPAKILGKEVDVQVVPTDVPLNKDTFSPKRIVVTGLSELITPEILCMYFENENGNGGGRISEVILNDEGQSAVIEFEEANAVKTVMRRLPAVILGHEVNVKVIPTDFTNTNVPTRKVKVTGFPKHMEEEVLLMYFENQNRQGGGKVKQLIMDEERMSAIIEFEEAKAAETVMNNQPIDVQGSNVKVELFGCHDDASYIFEQLEHEIAEENVASKKVKVSGLPKNITNDMLTMVFENENRQGGGRVRNVKIDSSGTYAIIEFEERKAVETVLKNQPIHIQGTDVKVDLFSDEEPRKKSKNKLIVSGLPVNTTEETLLMFFENEKRQGGGKVLQVSINENERSAIIEFEDNKAVETVLKKQPISFQKCEVTVRKYTQSTEHLSDKPTSILVTGISDKISEDYLIFFFENENRQGGGKVSSVHITENGSSAIVEFEDAAAVDKVLQKQPIKMMGNEVAVVIFCNDNVSHSDCCTKLKVTFPQPLDITEEYLLMFFEDEHRKGGGTVNHIDIDVLNCVAIIDFAEEKAVDSVLNKRPIEIMGHQVAVEKYSEPEHKSNDPVTMLVSSLPDNVSEDFLISFFENEKRQGGGEVLSIELNKNRRFAIIEFKESNAVKNVVRKQPIKISEHTVEVKPFTGSQSLEVSGFTWDDSTETELKTYFERKDVSAGEPVQSVKIMEEKSAIVTFKKAKGVFNVMSRRNHTLRNNTLVINTYLAAHAGSRPHSLSTPYLRKEDITQGNERTKPKQDTKKMDETEDDIMTIREQILERLGLSQRICGNITIKDMITVDPFDNAEDASIEQLPWVLLRRLMSVNCDAMDLRFCQAYANTEQTNKSVLAMYDNTSEIESINPLDVFLLVFQCCDPLLKQLLYQKLYLCKMAVPFIYHEHISSQSVLAKWPLRSLLIESKNLKGENLEVEVLDMPTRFISFARFGRPKFSKSKLLNQILSETGADTFFHRDCPLGTTKKYITDGYTEMFWLPTIGDSRCRFNETVTFLNMRGNIKNSFLDKDCTFIAAISDITVIICDLDSILRNSLELENSLMKFAAVVLVIANPFDKQDFTLRNKLVEFERTVISKQTTKLQVLCTHIGIQEKSATDILSDVTGRLSDYLKSSTNLSKSLQERINDAGNFVPRLDEDESCIKAKGAAESVVQTMEKEANQQNWYFVITPVQSASSSDLSDLLKQQHREKDFTVHGRIKEKMEKIRHSQTEKISDSMQTLMNCIIRFADSHTQLQYFFIWLRYLLERKKRDVLPGLMKKNQLAWDTYWKMKKEDKPSAAELDNQEMTIKHLEGEIEKASFGIENMFREIYHISDAILLLKKDRAISLCQVHNIADVIARMVSNGHVFELLDGNSFYMPNEWIKLILNKIHQIIGGKRVLTLSVLGLQSSGKSTLLNTMFGIQFSASSGRCTRGIHMQLLPLKQQRGVWSQQPFEYILVIDTEGLRAPELSNKNYKRDNELSTIITGLGDITILNVMGENTTELRDILQILIHAFLRLKLANDKLDIRKSCFFIHQNVTDITASEKMKTGLQLSIRNLDNVTEESALSEGISNIHTFNQVIEFDTEKNVWYLPNLWQGNPPVARVNRKYSEAVVDICHSLILKGLNETTKSFKSLNDIVVHTEDLWKGVLAEDFVFSFRNSLEKRAYVDLETKLKTELWTLEKHIDGKFYEISQNQFSQCDDKNGLNMARSIIIADIKLILSAEEASITEKMNIFFNTNNFKDTVIQWKQQTMNHIKSFCKELLDKKHQEVDVILNKRAVDIMTSSMGKTHEEELRKRSIELANELKSKMTTSAEINEKFEEIWNTFVSDSLKSDTLKKRQIALDHVFIELLTEMFENHPVMYEVLKKEPLRAETNIHRLSHSFTLTKISEKDISVKTMAKLASKLPFVKSYQESSFALAKERSEGTFVEIDSQVAHLCKEDNEITYQKVKCFLKDVEKLINDIARPDDHFTLQITFKIKIGIFVSRFALACFENHNKEYNQTHGLEVRLQEYKQQVKERFKAHLAECKVEDTAAKMFRISMEKFVYETVKGRLPLMVKHYLKSELPQLKYHLIIDILTDLVDRDDFRDWVHYIENPKAFANRWITEKSDKLLFDMESGKYFKLASEEIEKCLKEINSSITQSGKHLDASSVTIHIWIDNFLSNLNTYKFPRECLRDVVRELENADVIHLDYFTDMLAENIKTSGKDVEHKFKKTTKDTIRWTSLNPYTDVFEDIWGCPEQCIFCGEPCIKCNIHEGSTHNCLQHRPSGCRGVHRVSTLKIALTSCNFDVASDITATCSLYKYLCNKPKKEPCSSGSHPYKSYRKYLPNWDIEPSNDMEERSKFWMWHIATYKENLERHYCIDVSDVPKHWGKITKEEACESLRSLYTKGGK